MIQTRHDTQVNTHDASSQHVRKTPFWVRHYDLIVNLVTLGRTRKVHQATLSLVDLHPGDVVLDVGCGTGILLLETEDIVGADGIVMGLDVEPAMVAQARRRAAEKGSRAIFEVASVAKIPAPDAHFDVVFSSLMVHHLAEDEKTQAFQEIARVLKRDGHLVVVDINPARRNLLTSLPGHNAIEREDFVRQDISNRLRRIGFTIVAEGPHPSRQLSFVIGRKG